MDSNYGLLMVRPAAFQFNNETAVNNFFQKNVIIQDFQQEVLKEFDEFVEKLKLNGIHVDVFEDTLVPLKPDAVFPNNWIAMLPNGKITLFPMLADNRRLEKRGDIIIWLKEHYKVIKLEDLSENEKGHKFLEGTGSMIFDHENRIIYASVSPRTSPEIANDFAIHNGYELVLFKAKDVNGNEIYHTNVIMAIGNNYCIICVEAISEEVDKNRIMDKLKLTNKDIIEISFQQMENFCGNTLQVKNRKGELFMVCSEKAYANFTPLQINILQKYNTILTVNINSIETIGGGSARCMLAENYLSEIK